MCDSEMMWEQIYQEWKIITNKSKDSKHFPFYEEDFLVITREGVYVKPENYEIRWWLRENIHRYSEIYQQTDPSIVWVTVPQYPRPYDRVAESLWMYREDEESTILIWLAACALYYFKNNDDDTFMSGRDIYAYVEPILHECKQRNLYKPWGGKDYLPGSLFDLNRAKLRKIIDLSSIDDILLFMFFDICYLKANYRLVCLQ